ncbi:hypothetical protein ACHAXR_002173 [Thalassiosira sp. AJA248-18]
MDWMTLACIAHTRQIQSEQETIRQLQTRAGGDSQRESKTDSDVEYSSDEYEGAGHSDGEISYELPTQFLGAAIHRRPQVRGQRPLQTRPTATHDAHSSSATNLRSSKNEDEGHNTHGPENIPSDNDSSNGPPSPWKASKSKQRVIDALKDDQSDIHLLIGRYTLDDFSNVNFKRILQKYAGNKYKMSNFRENLKRLLRHLLDKTGPFKVEGVAPWYTSAKNVSRAYSLLFMLYMDSNMSRTINGMSVEELWESHPQFQLYELDKFKTYNKNMQNLTQQAKIHH